jgi:RimJ/RimL family protein N-acetyltransferase
VTDATADRRGVTLRETTRDDLEAIRDLWNDGRVMGWVGFPDGLGYDAGRMADWWEHLRADAARHHFVIEADAIGFCGEAFFAVDEARRRAGLDIKLRPAAQGRGIATHALRVLIARVFAEEPAVDAVWTEPPPHNHAARRLYDRCSLAPAARPGDLPPGESYWELRRSSP